LVIIDEVHRALSPQYRKVFSGVKAKSIICLTATLPEEEEYREFLETVSPIVYTKTLAEVVEGKVIPEFSIYNLEVPLSPRANAMYRIFDKQFNEGNYALNKILAGNAVYREKYSSIFDMARMNTTNTQDKALQSACKKYWGAMQMRKNVVYTNPSKLIMARNIISQIGAERK
jgi:superfamily II DNA or RNA helicase